MYKIPEEIKELLSEGISLIPCAESGDKKAYIKWKDKEKLSELELVDLMTKFNTRAVAIKLGSSSGGVVCLDIDVKHNLGFDAILFKAIKELYPNLWSKLRIEKTPSGGYHLIYRVLNSEAPRSRNLASRVSSESELVVRPDIKTRCFIELKAEGGLSHVVPSPEYLLIKKPEFCFGIFDDLSFEEHSSLVSLCVSFNEIVREEKPIKAAKSVNDFYDENPYEHFNKSERGSEVLKELGWHFRYRSDGIDYYSKPNREGKDIDATFNWKNRFYKIWSTTVEAEPKGYSASNLKCALEGLDKAGLYSWLVAQGFGKIKKSIEKNIIKNRAKDGKPLPSNLSEEAKVEFEEEKKKVNEIYPYGIFWKISDTGGYSISREELYEVCRELGFRKKLNQTVWINGYKATEVNDEFFFNKVKEYISLEEEVEVFNAYEAYLQNSGKFTISRLENLDDSLVLKSSKDISFKFFQNCYLEISKSGYEILKYEELDKLVWEHKIQKRDFLERSGFEVVGKDGRCLSLYYDFLSKAISGGINDYLKKCIGYYSHDYRDEEGYFVIATEQCENPKDGGGSGKNVFWALMELTATFKSVPASMVQKDNNLLQSWDGQRIFCISDMPKNFDLVFFKDIITGNAVVNKKYINEYSISIEDMPKIGGSSNFSFDDADPGIKRRVRAIEFTDFFTKYGGVKKYYGKMFPKDWDSDELLYFDNFIVDCLIEYLKSDASIEIAELSEGGWSKQFEQKYHYLLDFFREGLERWIEKGNVKNDDFQREHSLYCIENNINKQYTKSMIRINGALVEYCTKLGVKFEYHDVMWRENGIQYRGKRFARSGASLEVGKIDDEMPF